MIMNFVTFIHATRVKLCQVIDCTHTYLCSPLKVHRIILHSRAAAATITITRDPFTNIDESTLTPAWICNYIHHKAGIIFLHAPIQWETTLHCNVVSHWLGPCTKMIPVKCGMKLFIHSQTSMVAPLKLGNFIPRLIGRVITYLCWE